MTEQTVEDGILAKSLQTLAELAGGKPIAEKLYQVNARTLVECLGEGYIKVMNRLLGKSWIVPGLDDVNSSVVEFWFEPEGIQILQAVKQQGIQAAQASKEVLEALAIEDAKHLTQHFRPKKPDETVKVTLEKLRKLLGESTESSLEDRLDRLYVTKYCAANLSGENEYELTFFTKSVELATDQEKPPRMVTRQKSVLDEEGVKHEIDLRNLRNYELLSEKTRPEDIETVARSYLWNMCHHNVKRVARGSQRELQHLILLRGKDLPVDLYQLAKLRLTGFTGTYEGELPENGVSKGQPWRARVSYEPFD